MKCPICSDTNLVMTDRQGIEIDYCPACRGVWLDRGELDKLIERSAGAAAAAAAPQPSVMTMPAPPRRKDWDDDDDDYKRGYPYKKKKSLLGELFDF
jgi:Zn-finger nucleic acid-binding protein